MKIRNLILALALLLFAGAGASAQDSIRTIRPVLAAYTLEAGSAHLTDTYLTPLKYKGWHGALDYERYQAMRFSPRRWTMRLHSRLGIDRTDNPAGNATMWSLLFDFDWGMMRKFSPLPDLTLAAGGSTGIEAGCLYNDRNGNNPVSAKAAWTVNLTGFASYRLRLGRLPVTITYQPVLPVTGVFSRPTTANYTTKSISATTADSSTPHGGATISVSTTACMPTSISEPQHSASATAAGFSPRKSTILQPIS